MKERCLFISSQCKKQQRSSPHISSPLSLHEHISILKPENNFYVRRRSVRVMLVLALMPLWLRHKYLHYRSSVNKRDNGRNIIAKKESGLQCVNKLRHFFFAYPDQNDRFSERRWSHASKHTFSCRDLWPLQCPELELKLSRRSIRHSGSFLCSQLETGLRARAGKRLASSPFTELHLADSPSPKTTYCSRRCLSQFPQRKGATLLRFLPFLFLPSSHQHSRRSCRANPCSFMKRI